MQTVEWIPVDLLAKTVNELLVIAGQGDSILSQSGDDESFLDIYHMLNLKPVSYSSLIPSILQHLPPDTELVSLSTWASALSESALSVEDTELNPAVKLLDFFQGLVASVEGNVTVPVGEDFAEKQRSQGLGANQ